MRPPTNRCLNRRLRLMCWLNRGVEDARAGISAIHAAGMVAIGIGSEEALPDADINVPAIGDLSIGQILSAEQAAAERKNRSIRTGKVEDMPC